MPTDRNMSTSYTYWTTQSWLKAGTKFTIIRRKFAAPHYHNKEVNGLALETGIVLDFKRDDAVVTQIENHIDKKIRYWNLENWDEVTPLVTTLEQDIQRAVTSGEISPFLIKNLQERLRQ